MITIGKKKKGARRNPNYKRHSKRWVFFVTWAKRSGIALGVIVTLVWAGAWLYLSGAVQNASDWSSAKAMQMSVDAGFSVQNILVEGRVHTDADVLLGIVDVQKGDPLFSFNPQKTKEAIESISWVKSVQVERRFPDTVYIGITERVPLALWQKDKRLFLIDEEGKVLTDYGLKRFADLVMVVGDDAPENAKPLIHDLMAEPELAARIEMAERVGGRRWNLKTKDGMEVRLPAEDTGLALRRLAVAQERSALLDKSLEHIDLREGDRIIVQSAPGKVQEFDVESFMKAGYSSGNDI